MPITLSGNKRLYFMLIEFKFKNFKSFKDEQVFSMVASSDNELPGNVTTPENFGKHKLVNSTVVYGANAAGKSNLIDALAFVAGFVKGSFGRQIGIRINIKPFVLSRTNISEPTEFEINFIHENIRYQYGFSIDTRRVYKEWLIAYPKGLPQVWFERNPNPDFVQNPSADNHSIWYFGPKFLGKKANLHKQTRLDVLFLSVAAQNNHPQLLEVFDWFQSTLLVVIPIRTFLFPHTLGSATAQKVHEEPNFRLKMLRLLQNADLGIINLKTKDESIDQRNSGANLVDLVPDDYKALLREIQALDSKRERPRIKVELQHRGAESGKTTFLLDDESLGTRALFAIGGVILDALENGRVLVIDELDVSLHPNLVEALVRLFHDPEVNKNGAQLIFNTHDSTLLDPTLFRRDQIWFVDKDKEGASHLYTLLEFSPRKDEALQKGYLQGRYGAIPFIRGSLVGVATDE
jgi:AAA15 family ATPase/GTPase